MGRHSENCQIYIHIVKPAYLSLSFSLSLSLSLSLSRSFSLSLSVSFLFARIPIPFLSPFKLFLSLLLSSPSRCLSSLQVASVDLHRKTKTNLRLTELRTEGKHWKANCRGIEDKQTDRHTDAQTNRHTYTQTNRHTDR